MMLELQSHSFKSLISPLPPFSPVVAVRAERRVVPGGLRATLHSTPAGGTHALPVPLPAGPPLPDRTDRRPHRTPLPPYKVTQIIHKLLYVQYEFHRRSTDRRPHRTPLPPYKVTQIMVICYSMGFIDYPFCPPFYHHGTSFQLGPLLFSLYVIWANLHISPEVVMWQVHRGAYADNILRGLSA